MGAVSLFRYSYLIVRKLAHVISGNSTKNAPRISHVTRLQKFTFVFDK